MRVVVGGVAAHSLRGVLAIMGALGLSGTVSLVWVLPYWTVVAAGGDEELAPRRATQFALTSSNKDASCAMRSESARTSSARVMAPRPRSSGNHLPA